MPQNKPLVDGGFAARSDDNDIGDAATGELDYDSPTVLHLFGVYEEKSDKTVLTENEFFDLFASMVNADGQGFFEKHIRMHLATAQLLFVGFSLDDWRFRLLLRGLKTALASKPKDGLVIVQLDPADVGEEATKFLEKYFKGRDAVMPIEAFVGTAKDFSAALLDALHADGQLLP